MAQSMREVRAAMAGRISVRNLAIDPEPRQPDGFDLRLQAARARVAPIEPIAYRFVPAPGGFIIEALTEL